MLLLLLYVGIVREMCNRIGSMLLKQNIIFKLILL